MGSFQKDILGFPDSVTFKDLPQRTLTHRRPIATKTITVLTCLLSCGQRPTVNLRNKTKNPKGGLRNTSQRHFGVKTNRLTHQFTILQQSRVFSLISARQLALVLVLNQQLLSSLAGNFAISSVHSCFSVRTCNSKHNREIFLTCSACLCSLICLGGGVSSAFKVLFETLGTKKLAFKLVSF